ncbi:Uncharacterised protein [Mycobacterium tuberculosis]|nr:Uncharacterised protein [Mycobacterium tuberculosis]
MVDEIQQGPGTRGVEVGDVLEVQRHVLTTVAQGAKYTVDGQERQRTVDAIGAGVVLGDLGFALPGSEPMDQQREGDSDHHRDGEVDDDGDDHRREHDDDVAPG